MTEVVSWIVVEPGFKRSGLNPYKCRAEIAKAVAQWQRVLKGLVEFREGYSPKGCIAFQMEYGVIDTRRHPDRVAQCDDAGNNWRITFLPQGAPATKARPKQKWDVGWCADTFGVGDSLLAGAIHEIGHVFDFEHSSDEQHPMHSQFPDCRVIPKRYRLTLRNEFIRKFG